MTPRNIRVVVADDHPVVRSGIKAVFEAHAHIDLVGTASQFPALLDMLGVDAPDVVVLDLNGMGMPPLAMVARLQRGHPRIALVVFSSSVDIAPELLNEGVHGYVAKEDLLDHLVEAISAAASRQMYCSPVVQQYMDRTTSAMQPLRLSQQEFTVLKLLAQGLHTLEIAQTLTLDPRTVQNYVTNLRRKTGCSTRLQLVDFFRRAYSTE